MILIILILHNIINFHLHCCVVLLSFMKVFKNYKISSQLKCWKKNLGRIFTVHLFQNTVICYCIISMVFETGDQRNRRESCEAILNNASSKQVPVVTCNECKHVSENEERYKAHLKEPRHVNNYRDLAYKGNRFSYIRS